MVDSVESPRIATTVVFKLKFATSVFLPALADPYAFIYEKKILDTDPHWYENNVMGSGPFHFVNYDHWAVDRGRPQSRLLPHRRALPGRFQGLFATEAIGPRGRHPLRPRGDRIPRFSALRPRRTHQELGDKVTVQTSDWNCGNLITPNSSRKPFDDVRVRRALLLAIDQWYGGPALSKIANVHTVGGIVFPGSPLAATKAELETIAGFWPDIEKSRAEARRLLKEAGAEGLSFELLNRNVDQPYKFVGIWLVDQWSKIGVHATQKVVPTGPWFAAMRCRRLRRGGRGELQQHRQSGAGYAEISAARRVR